METKPVEQIGYQKISIFLAANLKLGLHFHKMVNGQSQCHEPSLKPKDQVVLKYLNSFIIELFVFL